MPISDGRYINPQWVNNQRPAINAPELNAISNTLQKLDITRYVIVGTVSQGYTASDCDYLCTGTSDDVQINAAIQQAKSINKSVLLLNGTYNISNTINLSVDMYGMGTSISIINRQNTSFQYAINMFPGTTLSNLKLNSSYALSSDTTIEIYVDNLCSLKNVNVDEYSNIGISMPGDSSSPGGIYSSIKLESVSTMAGPSGKYSLQAIKCTGSARPCYMKDCAFDKTAQLIYCGNTIQGIFLNNCSLADLEIINCQMCVISGNSISGSLTLSQSGGITSECTANIVNSNIFSYGGITLSAGTERNVVTGNGGGVSSAWAGVTDNGSNNYVANNMPT